MSATTAGFLVVLGAAALSAAGFVLVSRYVPDRWLIADADAASALYATIGMVYAILIAIAAIAIWEPRTAADAASKREAADLIDAHWEARHLNPNDVDEVQTLARAYLAEVVHEEWATLRRDRAAHPRAEQAFVALRLRAEDALVDKEPYADAREAVLAKLADAAAARRDRIAAAGEGLPGPLWLILLLGSLVSVAFLYLFGLDRTFPNGLMMATVGAMLAVLLFVLYQVEYPFSRGLAVTPDAFRTALAEVSP
ncbi:membrane protein [Pilimelia anulata]|uniref:Membrane protein n=1 Tax=Pilimelia anulata TaxID=53371 RepID=A0A8J3BET5_9ACTN|nr:DUF4239 domain-containing protein [Pilimelia anulata]GGK05451.1 membrane protein [Pilimelia anulata]